MNVVIKYKNRLSAMIFFIAVQCCLLFSFSNAAAQNLNNPNKKGPLGVQVNTYTGNLFIPRQDMSITARKFDLNIRFYYNSFNYDEEFGFGRGWNFEYGIRYRNDSAGKKTIVWKDGREDTYTPNAEGTGYKSPKGFFSTFSQYQPGKYVITTVKGIKYFFDNSTHRKLTKMQEPNGNFINFTYTDSLLTSLTNSAGQSISFAYNSKGRLASVTDANGSPSRTFSYAYTDDGNLTQVTDPLGAKIKYSYLVNGPVKTVTDKNNNLVNIIYYNDFGVSELIGCNKRISFSYDTASKRTVVTDYLKSGNNQVTNYTYQADGNIYWLKNMSGNCCGFNMSFDFDEQGNKIKETDANGNSTSYTYDTKGNILTVTDPLSYVSTYTYSEDFNKITSMKDPNGIVSALQYDNKGNLLSITAPGNQIYAATYNAAGDIISSTDPKGNTYTYNYDAFGNISNVTGPEGYSAAITHDARGNAIAFTDPRGNHQTMEYDILNRLKKITDPINNAASFSYDAAGNIVAVTDKNNGMSVIAYDAANRPVKFTNPAGDQSTIGFDEMNNVTTLKNAAGEQTVFTYDTRNRLSKITDPVAATSERQYDANGNLISRKLPNGQTIKYTYDLNNRLLTIADETALMWSFTYDKNNNITACKNGTGAVTTAVYDSINRMIKKTDPLGNATLYTYDKNNNIVSVTDRNGFTKAYTYDAMNRVKSYTDNNGFVIMLAYDAAGNIVSAKDQKNNVSTYAYDSLNRVKQMTYADGKTIQLAYDKKGNIVSKKLADGSSISYGYDNLMRLTSKTLPDGQQYIYTYDKLRRVTAATNNAGTISFTYDALGRLSTEAFNGRTIRYQYNTADRSRKIFYNDSTVVTEIFDTRNRLTRILKNETVIASYQYNHANQPISAVLENGISTQKEYDFANRLVSIKAANGTLQNTAFTYDKEGHKKTISRTGIANGSEQFTYDNGYRLTGYTRGSSTYSYSYDAAGNRVSANINGASSAYTANNLNQLTNVSGPGGNIAFVYDNNGNLSYDGAFYKTYDAEGRLLKDSASPGKVISYAYDAAGRRTQKNTGINIFKYTYSGLRKIEERDAADNLLATTVFQGFLKPVKYEQNNSSFYFHQNEMNSVEAVTNAAGRPVERYAYDPYGVTTAYDSAGNLLQNPAYHLQFGYTGQEYDSVTKSYKFLYRNYSPATGIFNQRDPLGYEDGFSLYQYAGDDPANGIDILGLKCRKVLDETQQRDKNFSDGMWYEGMATNDVAQSYIEEGMGKAGDYIWREGQKITRNADVRELARMGEAGRLETGKALKSGGSALKGAAGGVKAGLGKIGAGLGVIDNVVKAEKFAESLADGASNEQYTEEFQAGGEAALSGMGHVPGVGTVLGLTDAGMEVATGDGIGGNTANLGTFLGNTWAHFEYGTPMVWQWGDPITDSWVWGDKEWDCPEEGGDKDPRPKNRSGEYVLLTDSKDPNLIIGPEGEPAKKWVSVKDRLPYTVLFENDTTASAPARYVKITTPIEAKQDRATFQLGSFGFNEQTFIVPPNTASYYQRLDCRDSIGLFVDITAGYDQISNVAFWEFQSIDPVSLLPPSDPLKGFLLLKDTARPAYGNGFVNFSMKPLQSAVTLDTIGARASIVFDSNDTIPTNIHTNTIDAFAPVSHMNTLPATSNNPVQLSWAGADDPGGCGIRFYTLYVSADGTNYNILQSHITRTDTTFTGIPGTEYHFFVLATDSVGNTQILSPGSITSTFIGAAVVPVTLLEFRGINRDKNNLLDWSTSSEINSRSFRVERSLTGNNFTEIGSVAAAGNSTGQKNYSYTDRNIDRLNSNIMYYRLKQVDNNTGFKYSNIVKLTYKETADKNTIVYPNPTQGMVTIATTDAGLIGTNASLYDQAGKLLETIKITGLNQQVMLGKYANGIYYIRLANKQTLRVMKQ